jgi:tight adherence protein C
MTVVWVAAIVHLSALDPRVLLLPLALGLGVYLIVLSLPFGRPRPDLGERLRRLDVDARVLLEDAERRARPSLFAWPLLEHVLRPVIDDAGRLLRRVLSRLGLVNGHELEKRLRVLRPGVEVVQFLGEKVATGVIVAVLFPCMNLLHLSPFGAWPVWAWLVAFGLGFVLPDWDLQRREHARRGQVLTELPTMLDLLTLAISAGMAMEQALDEVGRHSEGVVAQELRLVARELALGQRRGLQDALEAMAGRLNVSEIDHVLTRLSATYDQGLPLSQALAAQAQALRERQRLHVVEEGGKATVRMLLPVALLILPPLFVVVLVPAAAELTRLGG